MPLSISEMSPLRELIRGKLLTEAAMSVDDLEAEDIYIAVTDYGNNAVIYYADKWGNYNTSGVTGKVMIQEPKEDCEGAWEVGESEAEHGWGPLLYDVAIEWATMNANGLTSDRDNVSWAARKVWQYYYWQRGDVDNHIVDLDRCEFPDEDFPDMADNPHADDYIGLAVRFTKSPDTIRQLMRRGRYVRDDEVVGHSY